MELWVARVLAIVVTFILPFICTILPIKVRDVFLRRGKDGARTLSWLMCFGGGVFLATYMLHMGPDVRAIMHAALLEPHGITYPITDLIIAGGFFLVLIIETTAIRANRHHKRRTEKKQNHAATESSFTEASLALRSAEDNGEAAAMQHGHSHGVSYEAGARSLVLALALSLHRIFEGMSIGLKHTVRGIANLFIAVMCHETVIGFSLGLEFVYSGFSKKRTLVYALLCSIIMPIGVAIGTIIMEMGSESPYINIVNGVLQAVSTGTFLYVTFFEILQDEFGHNQASFGKVISLALGFIIMAALCAIPEPAEVLADVSKFANSTLSPENLTVT